MLDGFTRHDFCTDGGLNRNVELLARNQLFQLLAHTPAKHHGIVLMRERGECIHGLAVEQDVEFGELRRAERVDVVVERGVALRNALELVVEVDDDFAQRNVEMQFHAVSAHKFLLDELAALVETEFHDRPDEIGRRDDVGTDIRLLDVVDHHLLGQSRRVVHLLHLALFRIDHIRHVGNGRNHVHVELAVEPLLHDFHVQQAEKTAAEAEAERHARFGLERERSVVQLEFLQRCAKVFVVRGVDGIHAGKHHRLHLLKALNGLLAGSADVSNRVAHLHLLRILDAADDIAYLARAQFLTRNHLHFQHAHLVGVVLHTRVEEFHLVALANHAVFYLEIGDDATERVEDGIENQCLQRRIGVARGRRDALHHCLQNRLNALARLSAGAKNLLALASQQFHDFVFHLVGHG